MKELTVGIVVGLGLMLALAAGFGIVNAHSTESGAGSMMGNGGYMGMQGMMMSGHMGMGNSEEHQGMSCAGMDIGEMDKNNDGVCDGCGMSMDMCKEMQEHMSSANHEEMQEAMNGSGMGHMMGGSMSCHDGD